MELAPIDERLKYIAEEKAVIEETLAELAASIEATRGNEMVLAGLERDLETLRTQYNDAVASRGQAQVGERIEVLSKGERFSLIEAPTMPNSAYSPNRLLISAAGVVGGIGAGIGLVILMEMLTARSAARWTSPPGSASSPSPRFPISAPSPRPAASTRRWWWCSC